MTKGTTYIIECVAFSDETDKRLIFSRKEVRKALRRGHKTYAIVDTTDGVRKRTSSVVSIKKNYIETRNSFYVLIK